ncbi:MAG: nitrogen fixation protein NifX [Magnetospirillum sp. WYHS-4]
MMRKLRLVEAEPQGKEGAMKVAIATTDMQALNAHFGSTPKFAVYEVTKADWRFVEALEFGAVSDQSGQHADDGEDRIGQKVEALKGCALVFVLAIGGPAAAKVVNARVHPIKVPEPQPIEQVLDRVRTMLSGTPPPWLRKAMGGSAPADLDEEDRP